MTSPTNPRGPPGGGSQPDAPDPSDVIAAKRVIATAIGVFIVFMIVVLLVT